jgi:serine/threonine-protein kinase
MPSPDFLPDAGNPESGRSGNEPAADELAAALARNYRVLAHLASDPLGVVFLAEQIRGGGRRVALRVFHPALFAAPGVQGRFKAELRALARLEDPSVPAMHECAQGPDGVFYIAREFVDGEPLSDRLGRHGPMSAEATVSIVAQCARALDAGHRLGITHREIDLERVVLVRDADGKPQVKLSDYGLPVAAATDGDFRSSDSAEGRPLPGSGSPWQSEGRPDIHSLALAAYAMLTGTRAAPSVAGAERMAPAVRSDVPAAVLAVVMSALLAEGGREYRTAEEFAVALERAVGVQSPGGAADLTPRPPRCTEPRAEPAPPGLLAETRAAATTRELVALQTERDALRAAHAVALQARSDLETRQTDLARALSNAEAERETLRAALDSARRALQELEARHAGLAQDSTVAGAAPGALWEEADTTPGTGREVEQRHSETVEALMILRADQDRLRGELQAAVEALGQSEKRLAGNDGRLAELESRHAALLVEHQALRSQLSEALQQRQHLAEMLERLLRRLRLDVGHTGGLGGLDVTYEPPAASPEPSGGS